MPGYALMAMTRELQQFDKSTIAHGTYTYCHFRVVLQNRGLIQRTFVSPVAMLSRAEVRHEHSIIMTVIDK